METTTIILIVAAVVIIFMIYLRFFKKEKDPIIPEMDPRKDEYYDAPVTETAFEVEQEDEENGIPEEETTVTKTEEEIEEANKEFDAPEEEITRIIPDEEIEQCTNEHEKEVIRITNYFVSNGIKNLTGTNFFDLQENIILNAFSQADIYTDIDQIFQITENRFVAITDLPGVTKQVNDQIENRLKGLLGLIVCRNNLGNAWIEPYSEAKEKEKERAQVEYEEAELVADVFLPETDSRIGKNLVHTEYSMDLTAVEFLSKEIEKLGRDYIAYINGKSVYIRINRPASLVDLKMMVDILMHFQP
jgi:hypothetical protein